MNTSLVATMYMQIYTWFVWRSAAERLSTVIAETWSVGQVDMQVREMEDSIHRRSRLHMRYKLSIL